MATYYWVGGSGNWDATSTANWSNASGGASGFGPPTSADNVIFDAASNTGTNPFTVTVTGTSSAPAVCADFSTGGAGGALDGAMTLSLGATAQLDCYGSMTLPATNFSVSATTGAITNFKSTVTGKTLTTNGVSFGASEVVFDGVGGGWTLGSALTNTNAFRVLNGTFNTGNYNISSSFINSNVSTTRTITLGSSTLTFTASVTAVNLATTTNLTFNAGTSTIICSAASATFSGGGLTFYNVTFNSNASGTSTINGANTFNDLSQTSRAGDGIRIISLGANQTVSGTLTLGAANTAVRRVQVVSDAIHTQRTITLNGTLATLSDVDFRDIVAAGTFTTPWTGTRLGNGLNNSQITFDAPKTVYWNLSGTQNWSAIGWATTNNGVPNVNNFPLAQDTAVFTEAGAAGTITFNANFWVGDIQMADGVSNRTTAFTLSFGTTTGVRVYGNITLFSNLILTGTGTTSFLGYGKTQIITSAGVAFPQSLFLQITTGTFQLVDNLTNTGTTFTLQSGTLNLNNQILTCVNFSSSNSNVRSIAFGTGNITVTGNNATIWTTSTSTNLTTSGTQVVNCTYSGSVGTRTITRGLLSETDSISFNITAGSDTIALSTTNGTMRSLNFTGFTGTWSNGSGVFYGNLTTSAGMIIGSGSNTVNLSATSGTQNITSNGNTFDFPLSVTAPGATILLQDNLTIGSTRTFTLVAGTLDLGVARTLSTGLFASSNSNVRSIAFDAGQITVTGNNATVWTTSTATNFSYTGTPTVNFNYSGSVGTRTVSNHSTSGTESNALNYNFTAGTDTVTISTSGVAKNVSYNGFTGTANLTGTMYGNLVLNSGMTITSATSSTTFAATSGTQQITSNGVSVDRPLTVNAPGATVAFQDALTLGSTRALTFIDGTIQLKAGVTSTVGNFVTTGTNVKNFQSTLAGSQATISKASGTVSATYMRIQDSYATGGATWNAQYSTDDGNNTGWNFLSPVIFYGITTEPFVPAETEITQADFQSVITEPFTSAESEVSQVDFQSAITEPFTSAETEVSQVDFQSAITEPFTSAEIEVSQVDFQSDTVEAFTSADSENRVAEFFRSVTEDSILADEEDRLAIFARTIVEPSTLAEEETVQADFQAAKVEAFTLASIEIPQVDFQSIIDENTILADSEDRVAVFSRSVVEDSVLADTEDRTAIFYRSVLENSDAADTITVQGIFNAIDLEAVYISDIVSSSGWFKIDDSQTPNWGVISNEQSTSWAPIVNSQ
jgi:hypothetical protein